MWFYYEEGTEGRVRAACFVEALFRAAADFKVSWEGYISRSPDFRVIELPHLTDEIPERFLERRLEIGDLRELDVYLGGNGTGTTPVDERKLPWP